jgi:hypothetical protein
MKPRRRVVLFPGVVALALVLLAGCFAAECEDEKVTHHPTNTMDIEGSPPTLDYFAKWKATRVGDRIEGNVEGLGPFQLTVRT